MIFRQIDGSRVKKILEAEGPCAEVAAFATVEGHTVIHSVEETPHGQLRHVSIAHPTRYPTWDEIKEAKYYFFLAGEDAMMVLPRMSDGIKYVNQHPNCFHLWQLPRIPGESGKWEVE